MKRRKLAAAYRREQGNRNRAVNRLHALFVSRGITAAAKKDLAKAAGRKEMVKALDGIEREESDSGGGTAAGGTAVPPDEEQERV
ncbi:MAG: hypothetical protein LBD08_01935 [Treponema sp.]|jgi:hypothetical protein|nr:hypothetical protein [Treponema sp.]